MDNTGTVSAISQHSRSDSITATLAALGLADSRDAVATRASHDDFHVRGRTATIHLASAVAPRVTDHVLDIGSGLGGPSRYLVETYGCTVDGIDQNAENVEVSSLIADRLGLAGKLRYHTARDAVLPFSSARFDIVWTQQVSMSVRERSMRQLDAARVLRRGGRFAFYDIIFGAAGTIYYPVPWSDDTDHSFLRSACDYRDDVEAEGFIVQSWVDRTRESVEWATGGGSVRSATLQPTTGFSSELGPEFSADSRNLLYNLEHGGVQVVEVVLVRR